ncbi:SurA N-terminal domain-containing protein [Echinicola vietnamensis]|uniref:Periplasmic chaperone PpiD n=1 Tax=Echinicola vietnamensis (strain DSM 17526 / LMG 23754 / KMM 6221) TaxID=926556 RepID=L0FWV6_ECHVK|nr:SurA N-terminal domain-containing protein [Echinicola vietnamensis]AGA77125.1 parvulin-like peptidyl-prolyl isomerase [Echinicola vietnamensis DSM 17526]
MALIKEIRQRTGLAIGVIAVGLILFLVGGDLLGPNSMLLGGRDTVVGEINGEEISYEEYIAQVEQFKQNYVQNTGRNPSENEMYSVREQAWQAMVVKRVFSEQYEELGMTISDAELVDMVQGKNIVAELRQQLTNPETGQFDRQQLISFLQSLESASPQQRAFWAQQERTFADSRLRIKYDNLLSSSSYATKEQGALQYKMQNSIADVEHLFVPYYAISDSAVSITDADLEAYLSENREEFEAQNTRDISYVTFNLYPSGADSAAVIDEISQLTEELRSADSDSVFVLRNSEISNPYRTFLPGQALPADFTSNVEDPEVGTVYGPFITNRSTYVSYKLSAQYEGTPRMRASHILFSTQGMDDAAKAGVKTQAETVLAQLEEGGNFFAAAQQYGQDGTAQRGGDLGWFAKEDFVEPFADAVFARNETGLIGKLIETEYGFHIINVTELPKSEVVKIAILEKELIPSDATRNEVFRDADMFAANTGNADQFKTNSNEEGYRVMDANGLATNARSINNLTGAREVVRWAFNDASVGGVSPVFELEDAYVVALLKGKTEEGEVELSQVKGVVRDQVMREKKFKMIADKLSGKASLEDMKAVFPNEASVGTAPSLKLSENTIPGIGYAPKAVGAVFGLEAGQITQPIKEDIGVVVAKLNSKTPAGEVADYTMYQNQLKANEQQRTAYMIMMAAEELAEVKDYRYKFF